MKHLAETASSSWLDLIDPQPDQVLLSDIALGLSRVNRFNGQTLSEHPYTAAQHSVWVAVMVERIYRARHRTMLNALLHDAHKAYTGDLIAPLRDIVAIRYALTPIEDRVQSAVYESLAVRPPCDNQLTVIMQVNKWLKRVAAYHLLPSKGASWNTAIPNDIHDYLIASFRQPISSADAYSLFFDSYAALLAGKSLGTIWDSL